MLKPELQAKYLQYLNNRKKNNEEGFTLIELLVVVIIIGVLAAIALPSLLGQVNKAKQAEAKNYVGAVNRAQQAYYLEFQRFATGLAELQAGVKEVTENFSYSIAGDAVGPIQFKGKTIKPGLKAYYGIVGTYTATGGTQNEALTLAIACESKLPVPANNDVFPAASDFTISATTTCQGDYTSLAR